MITLILFAVVAILIAALVYASEASTSLPQGDDLSNAKSKLVWVSVVGWLSVSLSVIFGIILFVSGGDILVFDSNLIIYLVFFAVLGLTAFTAWLCVSATGIIEKSSEYASSKDRTSPINVSYQDAYLASALSLGTIIALILVTISYYSGRWSVPTYEEYP